MNSPESPKNEEIDSLLRSGHVGIRLDADVRERLRDQMLAENAARPAGKGDEREPLPERTSSWRRLTLATAALVLLTLGLALFQASEKPITQNVPEPEPLPNAANPLNERTDPSDDRTVASEDRSPRSVIEVQDHIAVALPSSNEAIEIVQLFPIFEPEEK